LVIALFSFWTKRSGGITKRIGFEELIGFIGFIFGPILIAMFLLLAKIYFKEFKYNETHLPENRPSI
jgi:hypothetical protein